MHNVDHVGLYLWAVGLMSLPMVQPALISVFAFSPRLAMSGPFPDLLGATSTDPPQ